jgi:hypothetical protein
MLHGAAPADTEVRALGLDSRGRSLEHFDERTLIVLTMPPNPLKHDALARQGTRYECRFRTTQHTLAIMIERRDTALLGRPWRFDAPTHALCCGQAARNSLKCGSLEDESSSRTLVSSEASSVASICPRIN